VNSLDVDIITFINEYLENVYKLREDLKTNRELLDIKINTPRNIDFKIKINPIDIIIVLDNLISNSSKHNATEAVVRWSKLNDGVQLSFKDNGNGITDNILNHIFDFGFTTSRRGSGIGLYHVKKIIENMQGSIRVNNKLNKGVEFLIDIRR
jgi:signal transduction histidine kinase